MVMLGVKLAAEAAEAADKCSCYMMISMIELVDVIIVGLGREMVHSSVEDHIYIICR
jgi:hypothetical protein